MFRNLTLVAALLVASLVAVIPVPVSAQDLNQDGSVGFSDFLTLASLFRFQSVDGDDDFDASIDFNGDGIIDFED